MIKFILVCVAVPVAAVAFIILAMIGYIFVKLVGG
jgi:hypothetical protein